MPEQAAIMEALAEAVTRLADVVERMTSHACDCPFIVHRGGGAQEDGMRELRDGVAYETTSAALDVAIEQLRREIEKARRTIAELEREEGD